VAFDAFLKIDGIAGDSTDVAHKGEIQVLGFQEGITNSTRIGSATGGAGAGKATFQDFSFTVPVGASTPKLFLACASGQHLTSATLTVRKPAGGRGGAAGFEFLKYVLSTVFVSSVTTGGSANDEAPHEQFTLTFGKLQVYFTPENPNGSAGTTVNGGWDLQQNKQA
jgi:type VI secretion system secreted protein Hcp